MSIPDELNELNDTELATIAKETDPEAHRGLDREVLAAIITGALQKKLPQRLLNKKRLQLMEYVNTYWSQVSALAGSCPAKTRDAHACFQCNDIQLIDCAQTNPTIFEKREK